MFEIIMFAMVLIMAAKKRRKFRRYLAGAVDHKLQLSTLAGNVVIGSSIADVVTEETWLSSVKLVWSLNQWTKTADRGPVWVGVAHSDYTDTEIEAWIENTGSWETSDKIQSREVSRRLIRQVGIFQEPDDAIVTQTLNDGRPIRTKCGWMLGTGQTLKVWAYNMGSAAFATTDPALRCNGHANLWPK